MPRQTEPTLRELGGWRDKYAGALRSPVRLVTTRG